MNIKEDSFRKCEEYLPIDFDFTAIPTRPTSPGDVFYYRKSGSSGQDWNKDWELGNLFPLNF